MSEEQQFDINEDINALKTALDGLGECQKEERNKILGLMLIMLERIEIQIQDELEKNRS